ncbi:unnamed protein product, partial [marine sediment metagenome]
IKIACMVISKPIKNELYKNGVALFFILANAKEAIIEKIITNPVETNV